MCLMMFKSLMKDWLIDWLNDFQCLSSHSKWFHLYGDVTIARGGLQNLDFDLLGSWGL